MTKKAAIEAMKGFAGGKRDPNEPQKKKRADPKDFKLVRMKSEDQYKKYEAKTPTASGSLVRVAGEGYPVAVVKNKDKGKDKDKK